MPGPERGRIPTCCVEFWKPFLVILEIHEEQISRPCAAKGGFTMSLAFLAKKSWHTTNISNQEKVWLRQQEKEQEKKKTELLQKQMKEEREIEEMRQASGQGRAAVR